MDPRARQSPAGAVLVSALVVVLVLVVCYQCLQLYKARLHVPGVAGGSEGFTGESQYPACGGQGLGDRCRGLTTGGMPSIDQRDEYSWQKPSRKYSESGCLVL